ncbi:MAG: aldehyde dehydrogenase [Tissierellia bacterium]|nr:aldehyde dehydrogenase [Tissierellia bacterium]MDD4726637.1 aldehyde dehydrogenase [Tissierellia bacterium]
MFNNIVEKQRSFYNSGATLSYQFRMDALNNLKSSILENESILYDALKKDLNKSSSEAYISEIGIVLSEISYHQKHLHKWMKNRFVLPSIGQFPGRSYISPEPYGVTLIIAPWNYPINLCFEPLIGAISSGNTAVLKLSSYAPSTNSVISNIILKIFSPEYITVIEGGREENTTLLKERYDYIFFTGSTLVGKVVMKAAAMHLTPITLELGGKSPVIVDETANTRLAAKRVAFGKVMNAGQTCVAPDYILIHESQKDSFIVEFENSIKEFFPSDMSEMVNIISKKHYNRLKNLINVENIVFGGKYDDSRLFIEPTLIDGVTFNSPIMQEEIFGPILPIITYKNLDECIEFINSIEKPLALYLFTEKKSTENKILDSCSFGGGCINDVIMHMSSPKLPFGGVGASGMGSYHGKKSFDTFTHYRSIFKQSSKLDMVFRYKPYSEKKINIIKKILR